MFVSPSKLRKNMILRGRTLSFETAQKNFGNMVLIPTLDRDSYIKTLAGELFRPIQLLSIYVPRRIKPLGRSFLIVDQKEYYKEMRELTNNKLKKGKTILNAYAGQNLVYDIYKELTIQKSILETRFGSSDKLLYLNMTKLVDSMLLDRLDDSEYKNVYLVFPMGTYIESFRSKIIGNDFSDPDPLLIFLRRLYKGELDIDQYSKFSKIIFYNPNAKALITFDLQDPDFEKEKGDLLQKIIRLNNFNNGSDRLDDIVDDEMSEEDKLENKKEELKNMVLSNIAKKLKAEHLTDFEAAGRDEQELIMSIDKKIESFITDEANAEKTYADLVADVEKDPDVKMKAVRYVEVKKAAAHRLDALSKGLEKETEIIGSIQDLDDSGKENRADDFKIDAEYMDPRVEESHLSSLDEEYNQKQAMTDLTSVVSAFSNSTYLPITVDHFELNDSSTYQNIQKTLNVRYKTDDGKPLSFQIDVPDIVDKRYLYLGGNKKFIKKQLVRLPIVKTKADRVEITTNFNKMTIERTSGKLSRKNAYLLKKLADISNNPAITVEYGRNTVVNSNRIYSNDFEYEELAGSLNKIETGKYTIIFNRSLMDDEIGILDIAEDFVNDNRTPLGFEKVSNEFTKLVYIENRKVFALDIKSGTVSEVSNSLFEFLTENVCKLDMSSVPSVGKSFMYTTVKFLGETYPLFTVVASQNGLTDILKRYNIDHYLSEKPVKGQIEYVEVKFKDKYLYYKDEIRNSLLLSALYLLNTPEYEFSQFDTDIPYTHYFMRTLGNTVGIYTRNTLGLNLQVMVDPISVDVLKDLKLPTNIIDILLYANTLLVGSQYKPQNDMTNYRVRGNEIVAARLYKVIADAYVAYQKHRMNGRAINLSIPKNILIKELNALENINDKTTLNPVIEAEQIAQISAKGFGGVNLNSAYTLEMRAYDQSMYGFLSGNSTPYSGQAGITRALSYNPKISSVRGYIPYIDGDKLNAANILSPTELLSPYTSAGADAPRQAINLCRPI